MFARVITVQAGPEGLSTLIDVAERQLPEVRQRPGFRAFYLLTDDGTGELITVSFWDTREQMDAVARGTAAGIHDQGTETARTTRLGTFEVRLEARRP